MPHFLSNSPEPQSPKANSKSVCHHDTEPFENGHQIPEPQTAILNQQSPDVWISQRCMDQARPLKVIYIGAGISGITGAIEFKKRVPGLDLVIYEKNEELGGTWFENRYPGCACDVPAHVYQLSYESSPNWSSFFASASEILEYWKAIAKKYDVRKYMRFRQKCTAARWSETAGKWFVQLQDLATGGSYEDQADVLVTGEGVLNEWKWPSIHGLHSFKGDILHSANWDPNIDLEDKSVAVIGAGSSGLQIVPSILPQVKRMDHYVRGRSWIAGLFGGDSMGRRIEENGGNFEYTEEEKKLWENDRDAYLQYRRGIEYDINNKFNVIFKGSKLQAETRLRVEENMKKRLEGKPEIFDILRPKYSPYCKRMSPGPGYLEALASPKVDTITCGIDRIDENGVITTDGVRHNVDVIICATGFQTSPANRSFPIYGKGGINLRKRFEGRPETYLSVCTDGFPNFFQSMGPNSMPGAGSLLLIIEKTQVYIGQILARMAYDNIGRVEPKKQAVQSFTNYCDEFFKHTVFAEECSSWYKTAGPGASREGQMNGRVTALWPGSSLQCLRALASVRWEDFETESFDGNPFGWFGNGWTLAERYPTGELESLTWYLNDTSILKCS
ncbi:unnamed protein product [Clonostachys rhizophaga]|uniref:Sterigmatocystin biosynthesis monooxygenase stcW n=1 Tax=Clonostachys rhizophaga TaxID=160324 RepID=A0A9N9YVU9_9HYPO|nr:unnamed protein product [Clonostachys rhizophaga]